VRNVFDYSNAEGFPQTFMRRAVVAEFGPECFPEQ